MKRLGTLAACGALALAAAGAAAHDAPAPSRADYERALETSQAAIGRAVGEHALVDHNNASLAFSRYRGKPLVVSFVYTACSQVCPTSIQFLAKALREARAALGPDAFNAVTLGFNQPFDTPESLAAFARRNGIRDPRWSLLGGSEHEMRALTRELGFAYFPAAGGFEHIAQVTVLDAEGVVYRQVYGESFELPLLIGPLKELLGGEARRAGLAGVWDKVRLFCTVYDPGTGGYRLNYSLFIEIFAGASVLAAIAWFLARERRRAVRH
jgi:protein SCO1/2